MTEGGGGGWPAGGMWVCRYTAAMQPDLSIAIRQIGIGDAEDLCAFYNGQSAASRRTFRPLGTRTTVSACQAVCDANSAGTKFDLVACSASGIVGWGFVWDLQKHEPMFGLAVADALHGRGIGRELTRRVLAHCDLLRLPRITLTVVTDNHVAKRIYERAGFRDYGQFRHKEDGLDYFQMERFKPQG